MITNKLDHLVLGLLIALVGALMMYAEKFLPGPFDALLLLLGSCVLFIGLLDAFIMGHAAFYFFALLSIPFVIFNDRFHLPVRRKGKDVLWGDIKVAAFWALKDKIVLVRHFEKWGALLIGESYYSRPEKLKRMERALRKWGVQEAPLDREKLRSSVRSWLADRGIMDRIHKHLFDRNRRQPAGPFIQLDFPNREQVDFAHHLCEPLFAAIPERREELIQYAVWYALACDEAYVHDKKTYWDHLLAG